MSLTINIDGVDRTSSIRLESINLQTSAYRGEVGIGGFVLDDPNGTINVPAMKQVEVRESTAASGGSGSTRIWVGYVGERTIRRGPYAVGNGREWDVTLLDLNTYFDDIMLNSPSANRPDEGEVARVNFLLATGNWAGGGSTVSTGTIPVTPSEEMDKENYVNRMPRDVLDDAATAGGRNFFLYDTSGTDYRLFYDWAAEGEGGVGTGTNFASTLRLSNVLADVDSTTTFALGDPTVTFDPSRVYSRVRLKYKAGVVTDSKPATTTTFRDRQIFVTDMSAGTQAKALRLVNRYLNASDEETKTYRCFVDLPQAKLGHILAGHRVQVKAAFLGLSSFTYLRVIRKTFQLAPGAGGVTDRVWRVYLDFLPRVRPTRYLRGIAQ